MRAPNRINPLAALGPDPNLVPVAIPESYYNGLDPNFAAAVRALDQAAPPGIYEHIGAISGFRSLEHQRRLYESALQRYGSEAEARRWVAPPGNSRHNYGQAMDLFYGTDEARQWVHENAGQFGLQFPMSWENWHIEPVGPDGGRVPLGAGAPAYDPSRPPSVFNPPPGADAPETPQEQNAMMRLMAELEEREEEERRQRMLDPRDFMSRRQFTYNPIQV